MTELAELEATLNAHMARRRRLINASEALIRSANSWFDEVGPPLMREIAAIRQAQAPPPEPKRSRTVSMDGTEDWTEEDRQHYRELVTGVTRNK